MTAPDHPDFATRLEAAKLEALAEFAAGAGHEINNPVATIVGRVQLLLAGETDPARRQSLLTIGGQAYRIRDMIGDAMLFARPPRPAPQAVDLSMAVREVATRFAPEAEAAGCRLDFDAAGCIMIWADPVQLRIVASSLIRNSLEAVGQGGAIAVHTAAPAGDSPAAVLTVRDDGPGLSAADREHLFDPFYSGRSAGRGLGFGLAKAWRIVSLHGGSIVVDPPPGATFRVFWPVAPPSPAP